MEHRYSRATYTRLMLTTLLVLALFGVSFGPPPDRAAAAPSAPAFSGPANAHQGEPGAWTCDTGSPWQAADRFGDWSADSTALGGALPDGYLAVIASHTQARYFHAVLYSPRYGDLIIDYPFNSITPERGTTYATGRFDPTGPPALFLHGNHLKIIVGLWGGGGGNEDRGGRIYTWCRITQTEGQ